MLLFSQQSLSHNIDEQITGNLSFCLLRPAHFFSTAHFFRTAHFHNSVEKIHCPVGTMAAVSKYLTAKNSSIAGGVLLVLYILKQRRRASNLSGYVAEKPLSPLSCFQNEADADMWPGSPCLTGDSSGAFQISSGVASSGFSVGSLRSTRV